MGMGIVKSTKDKLAWAKGLRVGDEVVDCRYETHKIAELCVSKGHPDFILCILDRLPLWAPEWIYELIDWFTSKWGTTFDVDLILDNGMHCSVLQCCEPAKE